MVAKDFPSGDDVGALIFDVGSHSVRAGHAGEDCPKQLWGSVVGNDLVNTDSPLRFPLNFYRSSENLEVCPCYEKVNENLRINVDAFDRMIEGCFGKECGLGVDLTGKPVLVTEHSKHSRSIREKIVELMFEKYNVEATYIAKRAMLSSFAVGRSSGLTVDISSLGVTLCPVFEGFTLQKNIVEYPVGGDLMTSLVDQFVTKAGQSIQPSFATIKKVLDPAKGPEDIEMADLSSVHPSYIARGKREIVQLVKESVCRCADDNFDLSTGGTRQSFELPDGTQIECHSLATVVPEILFRPSEVAALGVELPPLEGFQGLPAAMSACIQGADPDLRRELIAGLILCGGGSVTAGLPERLTKALQQSEYALWGSSKVKIAAPASTTARRFGPWIGASLLASLGSFQQLWMSKTEYGEHGAALAERKCTH